MKKFLSAVLMMALVVVCCGNTMEPQKDFIKWIDFKASSFALAEAAKMDIESGGEISMIDVLSYLTVKNGNKFNQKTDSKNLAKLKKELKNGNTIEGLVGGNKYFKHYQKVYTAVVGQFVGKKSDGTYGIKAYHPIAKGYWYSEYDDFGNSRSYGFKRKHLGHDLFGSTGTPIIAVESGTITELGWNRYGGWRIGIRSDDSLRYYYYAHLRKNDPYADGFEEGMKVSAGDVIGYMGATGYSTKENVNMDSKPHLHFGMQIIFDESQEDGNGEIWIDVYQICKFLTKNRQKV